MATDQNARPSAEGRRKDDARTNTPEQTAQTRIRVDDSALTSAYANFCCVRTTPEELLIDFGVDAPTGRSSGPIRLDQRMILSHSTAKRLMGALHAAIKRHEAMLGAVEADRGKSTRTRDRKAA